MLAAIFPVLNPAQAAEPSYDLDAVVVTAKRFEQSDIVQPAQVRVIGRGEIEASGALSLPEALARAAGLNVRGLYGAGTEGVALDARGYGEAGASHVLVLLDGRRLNAPDSHDVDAWAAIPLGRVQRIEVQYGAGTVLYGDNALGAVVNIVTGGRDDTPRLKLSAGSFGMLQAQAGMGLASAVGRARFDVAAQRADGYRRHAASQSASLGGRLATPPGGAVEAYVDFGLGQQDSDLPGYLTAAQAALDPRASFAGNGQGRAERDAWHLRPGIALKAAPGLTLEAELGYARARLDSRLSYDMGGGALATSLVDNDHATWSLTPRARVEHSLLGWAAESVVGIDLYRTAFASTREYFGVSRLDIDQDSLAVYAQTSLNLAPATTLTLGARRQRQDQTATRTASAGLDNDQTRSAWDIGVSHRLAAGPRLFARHGRVFRFAKGDELTTFTGLGVPLRPEHGSSSDAGFDWAGAGGRVQASVYRQALRDEIAYNANPDGDWSTYDGRNENLQRTRHAGLTLEGQYRLAEDITLNGAYAYTRAEFAEGLERGKDIPLVPRQRARLGLAWQATPAWRLDGGLSWTSSQYYGSDSDNSAPRLAGYTTLDLAARWRQGPWRFEVIGRNLGDDHYASTGFEYLRSQYPGDGRALYLGLAYTP
jgi:iron complex outermembrane receptor protein